VPVPPQIAQARASWPESLRYRAASVSSPSGTWLPGVAGSRS